MPLIVLRLDETARPRVQVRSDWAWAWPAPASSRPCGAWSAPTRSAGPPRRIIGCLASAVALLLSFVQWELRTEHPMLPMRFFAQPDLRAGQHRQPVHVLRDVRLNLLHLAVLPGRAGPVAISVGAADPAVDGDADARRADRRRGLRPDRRPSADGSRARVAGHRVSPDRGGLDAHHPLRRVHRPVRPSPALAWHCSSPPSPTSSCPRSGHKKEGQASGANNAIRELGGVFGVAVLAAVFAGKGGYGSGQQFVDGMNPAVYDRRGARRGRRCRRLRHQAQPATRARRGRQRGRLSRGMRLRLVLVHAPQR